MKVKSESEVTQLCLTLRDPMDYSLPGSSIHGIFQARVAILNLYSIQMNEKAVRLFYDIIRDLRLREKLVI